MEQSNFTQPLRELSWFNSSSCPLPLPPKLFENKQFSDFYYRQ